MRLNLDPLQTSGDGGSATCAAGDPLPSADHRSAGPGLSLDALYRSQAQRLIRSLARRLHNRDEADDLAHDAFVRMASSEQVRAQNVACPEAFLSRIARNILCDDAKSARRRAASSEVALEDAGLIAPDQQSALEARDMLKRVEAAMLRLKPMTFDIFIAHRFHGYSRAEIAAQTGLGVRGVDKHMRKATDHLRRTLGSL